MVRLSRESSGGGRASKVSIPKYVLDPDLWYSGGRVTVHCCVLLWRNGLMWDGIRNGLDMELPEAILVGKGRGPFTVGMTWRKTQNKWHFRPDIDTLIRCIHQWPSVNPTFSRTVHHCSASIHRLSESSCLFKAPLPKSLLWLVGSHRHKQAPPTSYRLTSAGVFTTTDVLVGEGGDCIIWSLTINCVHFFHGLSILILGHFLYIT